MHILSERQQPQTTPAVLINNNNENSEKTDLKLTVKYGSGHLWNIQLFLITGFISQITGVPF